MSFCGSAVGTCKELNEHHHGLKSDLYDITVGETIVQVYCDIDTDGGMKI